MYDRKYVKAGYIRAKKSTGAFVICVVDSMLSKKSYYVVELWKVLEVVTGKRYQCDIKKVVRR